MSIRVRLTIAIAALLAAATVLLGLVALHTTRATMIDQIDERLASASERLEGPGPRPRLSVFTPREPGEDDESYRETAEIVLDANGEMIGARFAGYPDDPEALPELPEVASVAWEELFEHPITVSATDDSIDYRARGFAGERGALVFATSLEDVRATTRDLLRTALVAGGLVIALGAAAAWLIVGRGLRPVDRMIDTATAIAAGDLSQRVEPRATDRSELGRLAAALDEMLAQLEASFGERERSEARLRRFVGDASHELRTPVTAIRGYAELYRSGGIHSEEGLDRAMSRIESESVRMGALVQDLLLLARLDEHRPLADGVVDLSAIAADAIADLRATDPDRSVVLEASEPVPVSGDEQRLRQVLANLVENARVHTPAESEIRVVVRREGVQAVMSVGDDGPGIAPEHRDRVFERFYRADSSRARSRGGTGLGLSIVAAVVEAHGGTVELEDTTGRGATFTVRLPLRTQVVDGKGSTT